MNSVTITVPLPHKALSPNARVHWAVKRKHVKAARDGAWYASLVVPHPGWKAATVQATFYLKDRRGLDADQDNRIASLKAVIDGIALAGIVENDRGLTWLPVRHAVDKANPRVELKITKGE